MFPLGSTILLILSVYEYLFMMIAELNKLLSTLTQLASANKMEHKRLNVSAGIKVIDKVLHVQIFEIAFRAFKYI